MATAFAVFCSEDGSLNFYKRDAVPAVGDTFEGKVVDNIYLNVEQKYYSKIAELSWYADGTYQNITSVNCVDEISPEVLWGWFYQCSNLTYVNLRKLDTKNTTNMKMTFDGCSSLQSLDLSNFNTVSVINMQQMFRNCSNLATIYVSELWSTDNLTDRNSLFMFDGCTALSGDIPYVGTYTDKTYATYTGGYFTYKKYYPLEICGDFIIQGETLYDLADKIRVLSGTEDTMTPAVMADELDAVAEKMDGALFVETIAGGTAQMPSSAKWKSVTYGNGQFVAIASSSTTAAYSEDGITWATSTMPTGGDWTSVTYGNGRFVAISYNSINAACSYDGIKWTPTTMPSSAKWKSVTYGNGQFVAIASSSTTAAYSEDGINWTETTLPSSANWQSVTYGKDKFVAVAKSSNIVAYSENGANWSESTLPQSIYWISVAYGNGKFVALADSYDTMAYSEDGNNWSISSMPYSKTWQSVVYANGRFVAVALNTSGAAAYSDDGINWIESTLPISVNTYDVAYGNGRFVTVSLRSDKLALSYDGITWFDTVEGSTTLVNNSNTDVTEQTIQKVMPLDTELSTQDDLIAQIASALEGKSSVSYPALNNPGTAEDLMSGKQLIDGSGNVVTGTLVASVGSASFNDINFRDYDGTILYSYTKDEALALTALPDLPTQEGLICQGWNWSLENMQSYVSTYGKCEIGATYITDDGKTRIYIRLEEGRTSPMLGVCPNGAVTVDWGDGTTPDTLTGGSTSDIVWTPTHYYVSAGDYVITLTVDGEIGIYGVSGSNQNSCILRQSNSNDTRNYFYRSAVHKIEIGDHVTSIGTQAFSGCYGLVSITIPNSTTGIDTSAFANCYSLASITIPNNTTSIGSYAFSNCYNIVSIAIPHNVTGINTYAFQSCYSLVNITIPNSVTSIGNSIFYDCYSLESITIPNSVTSIETNTFYNCYKLESIEIPNSVTRVGNSAFRNCNNLTSITIPNSVQSIGTYVFDGCSRIVNLTIPDSVTSIGNYAISNCISLASVTIPNKINSINDCLLSNCSSLTSVTIPNNVTRMGNRAFINCYSLGKLRFKPTTPPTVSDSATFTKIPTDCVISVPTGTLSAYTSATNYPSSSTYTYIEED